MLERPVATLEAAADALSSNSPTVLVLDSYEVFRLLDGWMRQGESGSKPLAHGFPPSLPVRYRPT